ncbi:MAG: hypothetical protein ACR2MD_17785 [Aridibacter sp.]
MYRKDSSTFYEVKHSLGDVELNGNFTGKITEEQFDELAQNLRNKDFFAIFEKESSDLKLDVPTNFIKAFYAGKTREVSDVNNDLSSIKTAIIRTEEETKWLVKNR